MKGAAQGGEIVQVQGGHILRSTGRKDRHSKVYTAKGPRDRRVRLSPHTAIQFDDVQDRLGYDRPSKALDWLMGKAKPAIDSLNNLPPWHQAVSVAGDGSYPNFSPDANPSSSTEEVPEQPLLNQEYPPGIGLIQSRGGGFNSAFSAENAGLVNTMRPFYPAADDLRLSLHSFQDGHGSSGNLFQECFQRIDGWSYNRAGLVTNPMNYQHQLGLTGFSDREVVQSDTLGDHHHHQLSWNLHGPLAANSVDHHGCQSNSTDFGNPFDFGCGGAAATQGRIYEEEEPDSHV